VMIKTNVSYCEATKRLQKAQGFVRAAIEGKSFHQ
jgi:N-acetylmuramic acid 6-phosphate (MurNAc-6-P) etherase